MLETGPGRRAREAAGVDGEGLRNSMHVCQNAQHADYGTSWAAKQVLFGINFGQLGINKEGKRL